MYEIIYLCWVCKASIMSTDNYKYTMDTCRHGAYIRRCVRRTWVEATAIRAKAATNNNEEKWNKPLKKSEFHSNSLCIRFILTKLFWTVTAVWIIYKEYVILLLYIHKVVLRISKRKYILYRLREIIFILYHVFKTKSLFEKCRSWIRLISY